MALDKWIAVIFLTVAVAYGYSAYTYPLLPFELNMVFLPNTMPMALSVIAIILSLIVILSPKPAAAEGSDEIDLSKLRDYKLGQAFMLIAAMVIYALALRPIGFLTGTVVFLVATGWILGERRLHIMIPVALLGTGVVWFLVQQALGIFLRPLPWFMS
ncbi:MAG: tripartite tricarboxylate transporter TctB family protein [Alphaproteobacteria bacterium]|jgi:putative tricarboxylic transport membrane protein|nr:tripartite tricarboxylate transporter TctB family protein [Alphaproteobacteria bacterium]MBT4017812.1 tripartite tricarboxylate transporter TctB family protein [Alphaproteobacteria bacterium]MBT4966979.1 tripartite tricarboxylate transporter TctB family protein [Alphaproteobacteria bacterium]MBT5919326.1 tripartite tricarboxylate transporter TctB family protein [Alphaproteobacteria bacterium]MBT6386470.1 tripartite tricarboxylate transporter TctB family protein [Alphaproteobacteria bacterium